MCLLLLRKTDKDIFFTFQMVINFQILIIIGILILGITSSFIYILRCLVSDFSTS